jgi:hypothetical protein
MTLWELRDWLAQHQHLDNCFVELTPSGIAVLDADYGVREITHFSWLPDREARIDALTK